MARPDKQGIGVRIAPANFERQRLAGVRAEFTIAGWVAQLGEELSCLRKIRLAAERLVQVPPHGGQVRLILADALGMEQWCMHVMKQQECMRHGVLGPGPLLATPRGTAESEQRPLDGAAISELQVAIELAESQLDLSCDAVTSAAHALGDNPAHGVGSEGEHRVVAWGLCREELW